MVTSVSGNTYYVTSKSIRGNKIMLNVNAGLLFNLNIIKIVKEYNNLEDMCNDYSFTEHSTYEDHFKHYGLEVFDSYPPHYRKKDVYHEPKGFAYTNNHGYRYIGIQHYDKYFVLLERAYEGE